MYPGRSNAVHTELLHITDLFSVGRLQARRVSHRIRWLIKIDGWYIMIIIIIPIKMVIRRTDP